MCRGRILIVEDEYLVAADMEAVLEERGFETVGIAPDMETALSLAQAKPDLALVDIHLRDGPTGPQIAERLAKAYQVPVVFVTANASLVDKPPAPGVLGVLSKPCGEEVIGAAVEYLMARGGERPSQPPQGLRLY